MREEATAEEISSRFVPELVREEYGQTPVLRVWRGPEWDGFTEEARREFLGKRGGYPRRVTGRDIALRVSPWSRGYGCPARLSLLEQSRFPRMASLSCCSAMDRQ